MRSVYVYFPTVMAVKNFVESISSLDGYFDLVDGRCIVDARSLMGIFAMDLTVPIELRIEKDMKETLEAIESFIVKNDEVNCESRESVVGATILGRS